MTNFIKQFLFYGSASFLFASYSCAEGSAQMGLNQPLQDSNNSYAIDDNTRSFFVDILTAGEVINFSLCGGSNTDELSIEVFDPDGLSVLSTTLTESNVDCNDPMNAPLSNPLRHTTSKSGTYRVLLENTFGSVFDRYDITVTPDALTNPDPTIAAGRLWAYSWSFSTSSFAESDATDADLYALVPGGRPNTNYIWALDLNNFSGYVYNIVANSIGVNAPNSGYSTPSSGNSATYKFPIYLGVPQVADPQPNQSPSVGSARFIDNENQDSGISPSTTTGSQDSGFFEFTSDIEGTYAINIDINENGEFGDPGDLLLLGETTPGLNQVAWNGTDALGNILPLGSYNAQINVRMGEYHFVADDVETSGGPIEDGLTIFLSDQTGNLSDTLVYWDDVTVLGEAAGGTSTLPNGESSGTPAGRHTWGNFARDSLGDQRLIDTYVYGLSTKATVLTHITSDDSLITGTDGTISLAAPRSIPGDTLSMSVTDPDLNISDTITESVVVTVINDITGEVEQVELTETDINTGVFTGSLATISGTSADTNNNGSLHTQIGDTLTVTYTDQMDSMGISVDRTAAHIVEYETDTDGDGVFDTDDADDDNDGLTDIQEGTQDSDGDGIPDKEDIDSDNDGIVDNVEAQSESNYIAPTGLDTDGDGLDDAYDPDNGGSEIRIADTDADNLPDYLSLDSDGDGVPDLIEGHDNNSDGIADVTPAPANADGDEDGLNDNFDTVNTKSIENITGSNSPLQNTDGTDNRDWRDNNDDNDTILTRFEDSNGNGNWSDDDSDGDNLPDYLDSADTDSDGIIDAQDPAANDPCQPSNTVNACDTDGDGISDGDELANGTLPNNPDSDGDGIPDGVETFTDTDGDGLADAIDPDADNDGISDMDEAGLDVNSPVDTDGDGTFDFLDPDSDNDGIPDSIEGLIDSDEDGIANFRDLDSDNDGIPDTVEDTIAVGMDSDLDGLDDGYDAGHTGGTDGNQDGVDDNLTPLDSDGDNAANYVDIDSDNDGIPDDIEADVDRLADNDRDQINDLFDVDITLGVDTNGDGVDDDVLPTDTDGDGIFDYLDLDSDSDSLFDSVESAEADLNADGIVDDLARDEGATTNPYDTDMDGIGDWREIDSDNDGIFDIEATDYKLLDDNNDGKIDDLTDLNDDGVADIIGTTDIDLDGIPNELEGEVDTDSDGIPDYLDTDSDNDGIEDRIEAGSDPSNPIDTDGDGLFDFIDFDSDNDGILDELEGQNDYNNNGIPDYLEAEGEIETALEGNGGGGSNNLLMLLGLFVALMWKNAPWKSPVLRNKVVRHSHIPAIAVIVLVNVASVNDTYAENTCGQYINSDEKSNTQTKARSSDRHTDYQACWYGGIGYGYSYMSPDEEVNNFLHDSSENHDTGLQLYLGKQLNEHWFAELKYADLGEAGITNRNPAIANAFPNTNISYKVTSLMAGYQWYPEKSLRPYVKLGIANIANKSSGGPIPYEEQTSTQVGFATGVEYHFRESPWFIRSDIDFYDRDAWYAGFSVGRLFGSKSKSKTTTPAPMESTAPVSLVDDDLDGVNNTDDQCPNTPQGTAVNSQGCELVKDTDGDGVMDDQDHCVETPPSTPVDTQGCALPEEIHLPGVEFETNSAKLKHGAESALDEAVTILINNADLQIEVEGHTDSDGPSAHNQNLSERRAKTVMMYLIKGGVKSERLSYKGYGESQPIADNTTSEGAARNRRVVLRIL
ncbi:OmpA family protein [Marinibactrum halimedae]|uniref:OmpA-like domain-containing protein n=1 Tax=Marinibactrum halimedae TaxID=1444977 RepID=A0AA37WKN3_9GAMM|nr:OmpA family protein [Marinibactrum halimedae]MCD9459122.1 OmpA family protein [Marinibactrum halimedae]GLS24724.1 hypothetical protein GCM10007877_04380 [Marinibactrum halimedae]